MKGYRKRIADRILQHRLSSKGAVLIEGAKWCGKTTTALQQAKSVLYMQNPEELRQNVELAEISPRRLLMGETPRLIDEWQVAPKLWDAVRFEVDQRGEFNQFILTGSAVPADFSKVLHTGTGRISHMKMRPMSLYESGDSSGEVSLAELFKGQETIEGTNAANIEDVAYWICRGGWPGALDVEESISLQQAIDYYDAVINSDISRVDNVARDPSRAAILLRSYARHIGSQASIGAICADISSNEASAVSDKTVISYLKALEKIFVIENSPAWSPNIRSKTAIRTSDTRYYTDPSIATAALGIGPNDLINDLNTMGFLFENLCVRDLRVFADVLGGNVYHYRDKNGLECDAVIHLRNGSYGLIEIKLGGETLIEEGVATLSAFTDNIDTEKMNPPAFRMILVGVGRYAYTREDGIMIVPISCLKD